jgi:hypothetical protein
VETTRFSRLWLIVRDQYAKADTEGFTEPELSKQHPPFFSLNAEFELFCYHVFALRSGFHHYRGSKGA